MTPRQIRLRILRHMVAARDGVYCFYCGVETFERSTRPHLQRTLDHVVPVAAGGKDELSNFVIACGSCNSRKGALPLQAFVQGRRQDGRVA